MFSQRGAQGQGPASGCSDFQLKGKYTCQLNLPQPMFQNNMDSWEGPSEPVIPHFDPYDILAFNLTIVYM